MYQNVNKITDVNLHINNRICNALGVLTNESLPGGKAVLRSDGPLIQ